MTLTLDPRFPLLWRTPDSVQFGVDEPPVLLQGVSTAHERMLAALAVGLTPQGLTLVGTEAGLSAAQVDDFARAIRPALATPKVAASWAVVIDGSGPTADRLEWRLNEAGLLSRRMHGNANDLAVHSTVPQPVHSPDIAVLIGDYVLSPEHRGRWLRRDVPHLPILYSDTSVTIGPLIEAGAGPCLYCLELHHRDADPTWPTLASQLLGTSSTAQQPFVASEAATIATRWVLRRLREGAAASATALTLDVETGEFRRQSWQAHPECACAGITFDDVNGAHDVNNSEVEGRKARGREKTGSATLSA